MASSRHSQRHLWALAGVLLLAGVLSAIALRNHWSSPRQPERLRIGAFAGDVGALVWIAQEQGFFQRAGLEAELMAFNAGKDSIDALQAGQVDIATASEFVVADRSFSQPGLRILATICEYWNKGLIGRRDHGVNSPADLKGRRIGVTETSTAEHTLVVFLAMQGLTLGDVKVVNLPPKEIVAQMADGRLDAAITWQPHVTNIERLLGDKAVSLMHSGSDAYLAVLTSETMLAGKDEAFRRFLRALVDAEDWVRTDPARAKAWLAARFSLSPPYVEALWPKMNLAVTLPQEILEIMDGEARWLAKKNRGTPPNFAPVVHAAPLAATRPSAVTIFSR